MGIISGRNSFIQNEMLLLDFFGFSDFSGLKSKKIRFSPLAFSTSYLENSENRMPQPAWILK